VPRLTVLVGAPADLAPGERRRLAEPEPRVEQLICPIEKGGEAILRATLDRLARALEDLESSRAIAD